MSAPTFQDTIRQLEGYWADYGCVLMQPYHTELAAGTMNPATFLRSLGPRPWKTAYLEPVIRPADGRYGENPYRFQHYFQYQVVIKPAPADVLDLYFSSLEAIGIDLQRHDVRLVVLEQIRLWACGFALHCWLSPSLSRIGGSLEVHRSRSAEIARLRGRAAVRHEAGGESQQ